MAKLRFFDHAATTPLDKGVFSAMSPFFGKKFGNPSALYRMGREAHSALAAATATLAEILNCSAAELVYTGSATEADNLAILGTAKKAVKIWKEEKVQRLKDKKPKIIISQIEHKGIAAACDALEKEGFDITKLPVLKNGLVDLEALKKELDERTILVSITMADSETGTLQPISEISEMIRNFRGSDFPYFHTDATQAALYLDLDVQKLGADLMTISGHKIYGPKGIGLLFVRQGVQIAPVIYGGQQNKLRSGTENVPAIVGLAEALRLAQKNRKAESLKVKRMRDALEKGILKSIKKVVVNGNTQNRLPNFSNVSILDVEGEALLLYLDEFGVAASTGSACNSQSLEPSAVLSAMGHPYEYIHGSIRFTLGKMNNMEDVRYALKVLPEAVKKLRAISPLNLDLGQTKKISDPKAFIGNQTPHFLKSKPKK